MKTKEAIVTGVLQEHNVRISANVIERTQTPAITAVTDLVTQQITIKYDPTLQQVKDSKQFTARKSIKEPLEVMVRDATHHECGHIASKQWTACPGSLEESEEYFYEPIGKVLGPKNKLSAIHDVVNLAEDIINNTLGTLRRPHAGLTLFYKNVATTKGWDPAFEAYMRMQTRSWADAEDKESLRRHFTNNPKIIKAVQQFVGAIKKATGNDHVKHEELVAYVAKKEHWSAIAHDLATALEPLITPSFTMPMCGFGKQQKQQMEDPTNRERFARQRYNQGKQRPSWMPKEESLDALYSSLARQIPLRVEEPRKATSFPLVPYSHEPFDSEEHDLGQINFQRPMLVPESETPFGVPNISFGVPTRHIEQPLLVKKGITNFPQFKCAYLDCSETMKEGLPDASDSGSTRFVPWGDKSKYHHLCTAWYGIVEYLAQQQILSNVQVTLGAFSTTSRVAEGLENAKEILFSPEFGTTLIDPQALEQMVASPQKSVLFTVSDGDVHNWDAVKGTFIRRARENHYFHIQLGPATAMTRSLQRAKLPVYCVNRGEDLERLAVDLTQQAYRAHIEETLARLQ